VKYEPVSRRIDPSVGRGGWAQEGRAYPLPDGLAHKTPVKILEWSGWRDVIVRAGVGIWQVPASAVDCGREYRTKSGKWIPESDERARRYLIKYREAVHLGIRSKVYVHDTRERERLLDEAAWILERNGWEVPALGEEERVEI
jgi:hypothetical protein